MNGVLAIDKPKDMTSFDVVRKISKTLGIKAGHTGTLDPMATGVLVVCLGSYTKLVPYLMASQKTYQATIQFGISTDSKDITGTIIDHTNIKAFDQQNALQACKNMIKKHIQEVPKVSAVRVNGQRLYATKDVVVLPKREVDVVDCRLMSFDEQTLTYEATVSKGTYIRVLSETIASACNGNIGTTIALRRVKNGLIDHIMTQSLNDAIADPHWLDLRMLLSE